MCDECGERKPLSHARPTLTGMACEACVAASAPPPEAKVASATAFTRFLGWLKGE